VNKIFYICTHITDKNLDDPCIGATLLDAYQAYWDCNIHVDFEKLVFYKAMPIKASMDIQQVENETN
jgi:hypothetical protein